MLKQMIVRNIPEDVKKAMKHRAIDDDISVQELILRAIKDYLAKR